MNGEFVFYINDFYSYIKIEHKRTLTDQVRN